MFRRLSLFFVFVVCASAQQLDSNSITVTASRNANLPADQAIFLVSVTSGLNTNLSDILGALQPVGITAANFTGINAVATGVFILGAANPMPAPPVQWVFRLLVPLTKIKDTVSALASLQQSISKNNSGLSLQFSIQGTQTSQVQTCSPSDLIADARAQAQKLADASGLTLGNVLALSGSTSPAPICSITVKFGVTRFQ